MSFFCNHSQLNQSSAPAAQDNHDMFAHDKVLLNSITLITPRLTPDKENDYSPYKLYRAIDHHLSVLLDESRDMLSIHDYDNNPVGYKIGDPAISMRKIGHVSATITDGDNNTSQIALSVHEGFNGMKVAYDIADATIF